MQISARQRSVTEAGETRCPYCLDLVQDEDQARCERCETLHHASCFEAHGRCTVLGCGGRPRIEELTITGAEREALASQLAGQSEASRLRQLERLSRGHVALSTLEALFGADESRRVAVALDGARLRRGDAGALGRLAELARDEEQETRVRGDALRAIALQPSLPAGSVGLAAELLGRGGVRNGCESILRRATASDLLELALEVGDGRRDGNEAFEAILASFRSVRGDLREERLEVLAEMGRDPSRLAGVMARSALLEAAIQDLPAPPAVEAVDDSRDTARVVGISGAIVTAALLGLSGATEFGLGGAFGVAGQLALVVTALLWAGLRGVAGRRAIVSERRRELALAERELLRRRLTELMESPDWAAGAGPAAARTAERPATGRVATKGALGKAR